MTDIPEKCRGTAAIFNDREKKYLVITLVRQDAVMHYANMYVYNNMYVAPCDFSHSIQLSA